MSHAKRAFDVTLATIGLLALAPAFVVIAVLIKREDGGPAFYGAVRVGRGGRRFRVWKIRTMRVGADRTGIGLTVGDDPRITRIGRTLRKYKLDELPQLMNVLVGEMSLVGPRPEDPRYVDRYTGDQRAVLDVVPGITDPASLAFSEESALLGAREDPETFYLERVMPEKIRLNLEYAARATLRSDLGVIIRTLVRIAA